MTSGSKITQSIFAGALGNSPHTRDGDQIWDHIAQYNGAGRKFSKWMALDNPETCAKVVASGISIYDENSFGYDVNAHQFRCDDFSAISTETYNVVFLGCSITYGAGIPIEHSWSKILHDKIAGQVNKASPYINLSAVGVGVDHQARMLQLFAKQFKKIDAIICLFPSMFRTEILMSNTWLDRANPISAARGQRTSTKPPEFKDDLNLFDRLLYRNEFYVAYNLNRSIALIDTIATMTGAIVIINSWDYAGAMHEWLEPEYYRRFYIPDIQFIHATECFPEFDFKLLKARDGIHPPHVSHLDYANKISSHVLSKLGLK